MKTIEEAQYFASRLDRREISREVFASSLTRLITEAIGCQRGAIWLIGTSHDDPALICLASHDARFNASAGLKDSVGSRADFLGALERHGSISASNARTHPATSALYESTLVNLGVESMLAAAFSINGELHGAFTCTSIGEPTSWSAHQVATLKRLVARVSPALARTELRASGSSQQRGDVLPYGAVVPAWMETAGTIGRHSSIEWAGLVQDRGLAGRRLAGASPS